MKKSLTLKMFVTLLASFFLIIGITVSLFFIYFQYYYETEKINRVIDHINSFSKEFRKEQWTDNQLHQQLTTFNNTNSLILNVYAVNTNNPKTSISYNAEIKFAPEEDSYYYLTVLAGTNYYHFLLKQLEYERIKKQNDFYSDEGTYIEGLVDDYNFMIVNKINNISIQSADILQETIDTNLLKPFSDSVFILSAQEIYKQAINGIPSVRILNNSTQTLSEDTDDHSSQIGSSTDKTLPSTIASKLEEKNTFYNLNTYEKNGITYSISTIPYTDYHQVTFSKMLMMNDQQFELYTTLSMQPVNEIVDIMISYIPHLIILALALAGILALSYSRSVSKPVVEITEVASNMANMDLDNLSHINREDELGKLSSALNTLATNLKLTMEELVERNKQLAYDFKIKQKQEEARKAFVANASHELKTPLGVIKSYTEAIKDGVKKEKQAYYMDVILDEIDHMDHLILDMLSLSRFDAQAVGYQCDTFEIGELVDSTLSCFVGKIHERSLFITVKKPLGLVQGDKEKINQVIINLLHNSIKYATEHTTIRVDSIIKKGKTKIYFYNECPPFTNEQLLHIWDRFYKIDESHTRSNEGNGLGLAIVKSILEGQGSSFGVYNTLKGVCFYFDLDNLET